MHGDPRSQDLVSLETAINDTRNFAITKACAPGLALRQALTTAQRSLEDLNDEAAEKAMTEFFQTGLHNLKTLAEHKG